MDSKEENVYTGCAVLSLVALTLWAMFFAWMIYLIVMWITSK